MPRASVFLSFHHRDADVADALAKSLRALDVATFTYRVDLEYSAPISASVRDAIEDADHLAVLLSSRTHASQWVERELGLAVGLQRQRGISRPTIVGIRIEDGVETAPFELRGFESGLLTGELYSFNDKRCVNWQFDGADEIAEVASFLLPRLESFGLAGATGLVSRSTWKCYETLFPDVGERDSPEDVQSWLDVSSAPPPGYPWKDVLTELRIGTETVGLSFISVHVGGWAFGSYLGVRFGWRQFGRAALIAHEAEETAKRCAGTAYSGILLEADTFDSDVLRAFSLRKEAAQRLDQYADWISVRTNLRALLRLELYQRHGAQTLMRSDGLPVRFVQPAISEPLVPSSERERFLLAHGARGRLNARAAVDFIYDQVYGDAYGTDELTSIPQYTRYLTTVKNRVLVENGDDWHLGRIDIPRDLRRLVLDAEQEGLLGTL